MKNRALLSALALCFIAAGCDSQKTAKPPEPKTTAAVVPLPPPAPTAPAASSSQDAKPLVAQADVPKTGAGAPGKGNGRKGCTQGRCKVVIDVVDGTPCAKATPDKLNVYEGNKKDTLVWTVNTNGWKFAETTGIKWKDANQQQFTGGARDSGNHKKFTWKDENSDDLEYKYLIHLVSDDGKKKCDVDPSAINGASDQSQQDGGG